jgi:Tfp pilus assembly protein PilF
MTAVRTFSQAGPLSSRLRALLPAFVLLNACAPSGLLLTLARAEEEARHASSAPAFRFERIGPAPHFRPLITNVQIADLDGDGSQDVVACDAQRDAVFWHRRTSEGSWEEQTIGPDLIAPAHATVVDLDQDKDLDVLVAVMGNVYPDDDVIGSLVLLQNDGGKFSKKTLLRDVRRVVDAQPGDFDRDGDVDLAVAVFGYKRGQVLWLENRGQEGFRDHELLSAPGTIHVPVADYDQDGDLDVAAVVSQEEEEVWGFENLTGGRFAPRRLWMTLNYDIGSAGLVPCDLDKDGDVDLLLPVGDNLEDSYSTGQPYHGCLWLKNNGQWKFEAERIATLPCTYAAAPSDLDGDGDQDVVLCSMAGDWESPGAASLAWLENNGAQRFAQHALAADPNMLVTAACGDLDGDQKPDIVAGGLHMYPPYQRLGRLSAWMSRASGEQPRADIRANGKGANVSSNASSSTPDALPPNLERLDRLTRADLERAYQKNAAADVGVDGANQWIEMGRAYYVYGFFPAAKACFEKALKSQESAFEPNFLLGVNLARLGNLSTALDRLSQALSHGDVAQRQWVQYELGRCYLRLEDAAKAEKAFVAAGNHYLALAQLAKLRIRSGRAAEAVASLNALARLQPGATDVFLLNARAANELHDAKMAQQFRDRAEYNARALPRDYMAKMVEETRTKYGAARRVEEARRHIQNKRWDEAAAILPGVVDATHDQDATILLAGAQLQAGHPVETIKLLETMQRDRGSMPTAMLLLGDAYLAKGDLEKAQAIWERTARARTGAALHERLAALYEKKGNGEAARHQRALKAQAAGISLLRQGNPNRAKDPLKAAVGLDSKLPDAWFYLGECDRVTGELEAARQAYSKALELAPEHGRAFMMLKALSKTN